MIGVEIPARRTPTLSLRLPLARKSTPSAERVRAISHCPMAIGVRLDDSDHATPSGEPSPEFTKIARNGAEIDLHHIQIEFRSTQLAKAG